MNTRKSPNRVNAAMYHFGFLFKTIIAHVVLLTCNGGSVFCLTHVSPVFLRSSVCSRGRASFAPKRHGNGRRHGSGRRRCRGSSPASPPSPASPELVRVAGRLVVVVVVPERAAGRRQHDRPHELILRASPRRLAGRTSRGQGLPSPPGCGGRDGRGRGAVPPRLAHRHRSLLSPTDPLAVRATPAHIIAR